VYPTECLSIKHGSFIVLLCAGGGELHALERHPEHVNLQPPKAVAPRKQ